MSLGTDEQRQVNFLVVLTKQLHAQAQTEGDPITVEGVLDNCIEWEKIYQDKDLRSLKPIVMKRLIDGSFGTTDTTTERHKPEVSGFYRIRVPGLCV